MNASAVLGIPATITLLVYLDKLRVDKKPVQAAGRMRRTDPVTL
jgi:hypothetical protein